MKWTIALTLVFFAGCTQAPTPTQAAAPKTSAPPTTAAALTTPAETPKISCKRGKDIRTLEVTQKAPGYLLDYEKRGKMTSISKSPIGLNQCVEAEKRIEKKLEHAGFNCT